MLCSDDDLCYIICTVLRGRYCVIQHSCCNTNKTIIIIATTTANTETVKLIMSEILTLEREKAAMTQIKRRKK